MGKLRQTDALDQAFAQGLLVMGPELMRLATAVLDDPFLAEDAVAGTYLKAWEKRGTIRDDAKLNYWLKRICRNCALDLRRRRLRDRIRRDPETLERASTEAVPGGLSHEELLERLPDKLKSVARMRFVDEMGYSEIAQIERLPTSTVRGRIHLAREQLRREIEMSVQHTEPKNDAWDDGVVRPSPDGVIRWRGMSIRALGAWRPGEKPFYAPSGRRLSRLPSLVRQSNVFNHWDRLKGLDAREHVLMFFQRSGAPGYTFVLGCKSCTESPDSRLSYSFIPIEGTRSRRRRITAGLIGDVVDDDSAAVRFLSDFTCDCSVTAIPGWGAVFVFPSRAGKRKNTCSLSLAYSSSVIRADWAVRALVKDDQEISAVSLNQAGSQCSEGHLTGIALTFPVPPKQVKGIVFRPRWHAKADWGSIAMPPLARSGTS